MRGEYLFWLTVGLVIVLLIVTGFSRLSPSARLRRRLRKTHSRIVSKSRQPSVKFSVEPPRKS